MKPHQICKKAGLKSLAELSKISKTSVQTLNNWAKFKPKVFKCVLLGAVIIKNRKLKSRRMKKLRKKKRNEVREV